MASGIRLDSCKKARGRRPGAVKAAARRGGESQASGARVSGGGVERKSAAVNRFILLFLVAMDVDESKRSVREAYPAGGVPVTVANVSSILCQIRMRNRVGMCSAALLSKHQY